MNFELSDEQRMLRESVSRFIEKSYTFKVRQNRVANENGFSREAWNTFAEMGWLGVSVPEQFGGLGFSSIETAIIAEELGKGLVLEPYLMCGLFPAAVLVHCAASEHKQRLLPQLTSAETLFAVACSEPDARGDLSRVDTRARPNDDGSYRLDGQKSLVVGAPVADQLIVGARTEGADSLNGEVSLFLVDANTEGVRLDTYSLLDGTPAADMVFTQAIVPSGALLTQREGVLEGLQQAVDETLVAICAELVGDMEDAIPITAEYIKTRKQFGVPIGSFQVLQHRMADMAIELSQARASLHRALAAVTEPEQADRSVTVSGCKAQIFASAYFVTSQCIQLHGGYGITEEYRIGHHFRRLLILDPLFGDRNVHLNRYATHLQKQALKSAELCRGENMR